jgi:carboxyl-terminal processing protease
VCHILELAFGGSAAKSQAQQSCAKGLKEFNMKTHQFGFQSGQSLRRLGLLFAVASVGLVAACGGGGSSPAPAPAPIILPPAPAPAPAPVSLASSSSLECRCTGNTAATSTCAPVNAAVAPNACSDAGHRRWLRSYIDENYLFYRNTSAYVAANTATREHTNFTGSPASYFTLLTSTANPVDDRFSFTLTKEEAYTTFSGGGTAGYGVELSSPYPSYRVIYTEPNSPAARAGVPRGATLVSINGARMVTANDSTGRSRMYFPTQAAVNAWVSANTGDSLSLAYLPANSANTVTVVMTAAQVTPQPVLMDKVIDTPTGKVGYIVFNDHIATAQNQMADAFARMATAGVSDLVLDLRYNGGGYVFIAAQAAYMIGGSRVINVPIFDRLTYNDKRSAENFTYPFLNTYVPLTGRTDNRNGSLPATLNLPRVYILTQDGTCSASESIISGLKGTRVGTAGVDVIQIGGTTCGKPYGFSQDDNFLTAHFAIEFYGVNNKGEGGFVNGIAANCSVSDDLNRPLGDVSERMLATALATRSSGSCNVPTSVREQGLSALNQSVGRTHRNAALGERIHLRGLKLDR